MTALRLTPAIGRAATVGFTLDGEAVMAPDGECLAVALACLGRLRLRNSPRAGTPRGAFCMVGVCQDCTVVVDGLPRQACRTAVRAGLDVRRTGS